MSDKEDNSTIEITATFNAPKDDEEDDFPPESDISAVPPDFWEDAFCGNCPFGDSKAENMKKLVKIFQRVDADADKFIKDMLEAYIEKHLKQDISDLL